MSRKRGEKSLWGETLPEMGWELTYLANQGGNAVPKSWDRVMYALEATPNRKSKQTPFFGGKPVSSGPGPRAQRRHRALHSRAPSSFSLLWRCRLAVISEEWTRGEQQRRHQELPAVAPRWQPSTLAPSHHRAARKPGGSTTRSTLYHVLLCLWLALRQVVKRGKSC